MKIPGKLEFHNEKLRNLWRIMAGNMAGYGWLWQVMADHDGRVTAIQALTRGELEFPKRKLWQVIEIKTHPPDMLKTASATFDL